LNELVYVDTQELADWPRMSQSVTLSFCVGAAGDTTGWGYAEGTGSLIWPFTFANRISIAAAA
jgi:hypothetical protein